MRYCSNCGSVIEDNSKFCANCGTRIIVENPTPAVPYTMPIYSNATAKAQAYKKLAQYEKTSGFIWMIIGIIQCITMVGVICGIWNIVVSIQRIKYGKTLETHYPSGVYNSFNNQLTSIVVILIVNVFFGAIIGIIGAIFDLVVRNYVIKNREIFDDNSQVTAYNPGIYYTPEVK